MAGWSGRPRRAVSAVTAGVLGLGGALVVVATPVTPAPTAAAAPGDPGVPGDPEVLYTEDFENAPDGSNILLTDYQGAQGTTYSAAAFWANRPNCNGFIVDWGSPRDPADCTDVTNAVAVYDAMLAIPHALGQLRGVDPQTNGAAASYTADGATGAQIQFQTATPITLPVANRFVTFSVDAGAMNCTVSAPLLRFYFLDAANTETPVSSSPINVCTDPRGQTTTGVPTPNGTSRTVQVGTFAANGSTLVTGDTLGIRMRNQNSAANGNDGAYDNIEVLDVSPQLDKEFAPTSTIVGGRSTLTFTVTNTSELAAKDGWEFTDNLPDGLVVARPAAVETDCDADVAADGGGTTIAVTNGVLDAGETSCTISVAVTSRTAGTYTNGPSEVEPTTGLDLPGETSVTFTPFEGSGACPTPAFLFQNAPSATPTEIDLVTGEQTDNAPLTDVAFNGVGYSELADAFFGFDNPTDHLYLVSPDFGTVENLGSPDYTNVSFTFAQLFPNGIPVGDVSPDGVMYAAGGSGAQRSWMAVDVDQDSPTFLQVLDGGTVPAPAPPINSGLDWVYNPDDGRLYSFGVNTNNGNVFVYAFDPENPSAGFVQVAALGALTAPNGQAATGGNQAPFGATYGSPGFLYGANNQTGQIWRIPVDDPTSATFFAYGPGPTNNNDGARCASASILADLGDAPDSYGTSLSEDGARHGLVGYDAATNTAPLMLGDANTVDPDDDGTPTADASGDDAAGVDDEAAVDSPVEVSPTTESTVSVTVTNDADEPATLAGWIDLDGDGAFAAGERATATVPAGSGTAGYDLTFPAATTSGDTFARFRVFAGSVDDPSPTGAVSGGEVEDHPATVVAEPFVPDLPPQCGTAVRYKWIPTDAFYNDNFGTASILDLWVPEGGVVIDPDGAETTDNGVAGDANPYLSPVYVNDATGATRINGGLLGDPVATTQIPDASSMAAYGETVTDPAGANGLVPRSEVLLTVSHVSGAPGTPVSLTVSKADTNTVLTAYVTDSDGTVLDTVPWRIAAGAATETLDGFDYPADGQLYVYTLDLDPAVQGQATSVLGFACPTDLGDAPDSYGTTVAADGPQHEILAFDPQAGTSPLMLGAAVDAEDDGVPTTGADGDDTTGADDEDGVADPIAVSPVGPTTVTVSVTNDTDTAATLAGWVDLDGDGVFQADERQTTTVPASSGTADHELTFPAATTTAGTYARFRVYPGDVATPSPTGAATGGEVEDHPVELLQAGLTITKTADVAETAPGETVTYTVTVENSGGLPYTADDPASFTDDLTGVLDDATWVGATADVGATSYAEPILSWSGALEPGDVATITYAVTVDDPVTGDGTLTNAVVGPPESGCDDGTEAGCTVDVPVRMLEIGKTSDVAETVPGGTVTYTVTVTNTGQVPYTVLDPASFTDDLSGVLDDAALAGDPTADVGTAAVADGTLTWSGPLGPGDVATITYAVTVDDPLPADGDGTLTNAVVGPPESGCDDGTEAGCTADVPVRALTITKESDAAEVIPGQTVTYTVTVTNSGQVAYDADAPAAVTDDLTDVLGDATWNDDADADVGATSYAEPTLSWSGALAPGDVATITYSVTVNDPPTGDGVMTNAVVGPPESNCDDGTEDECVAPVPDRSLQITKTADVDEVVPGGTVTYTVTVENTGATDYPADAPAIVTDDLSGVLDDAAWNDDADADVGSTSYAEPTLTWSGALEPGDVATITYSVTVDDPADGDDLLVNAVTGPPEANCDAGAEEPAAGCAVTVPVRELEITKTADPAGEVLPGGTVTYTVTVASTGQAPYTLLAPASITDDLSGVLDDAALDPASLAATTDGASTPAAPTVDGSTLSWSGTLAVGETVTLTYAVTVDDPVTGDGTLDNAVVGPPESGCDDGTEDGCSTSVPVAGLTLTKTSDVDEVLPGGTVTYTVTVENTGQTSYTADDPASFTDDLTGVLDDAAWGGASADVGATSYAEPILSWSGALAPGDVATITYAVTVDDPPTGDGTLTNAVVGPSESSCDDGTEEGCTVDVPVRALEITKTAEPAGEVLPGGTVTYTVTVTNTGQVPYTSDDPATFDDDLSAVLDDASYDDDAAADVGTATYAEPELSWSGALAPGDVATITYSVTVDDPPAGDGILTNAVVGPPESGCDDGAEEPGDGCTTDVPVRALEISKSADPAGEVLPGGTVTYTVTVENTGQVAYTALTPATFDDDLTEVLDDAAYNGDAAADVGAATYDEPSLSWAGGLAPGDVATITYSVTVDDPPAGDGTLTNAVVGPPESGCDEGAEEPGDGCATDVPVRALHVTKESDAAGEAVPGDVVTYTVTVTNTGQVPYTAAAPAAFTDDLSEVLDDATYEGATADVGATSYAEPVLSWSGALAPGDVATITYTVTVNDPPTGDGSMENVVVGPPGSNCTDPDSDDPDCVEPNPVRDLTITKTSDTEEVLPGGTVTYTVTVENTGQVAYTALNPASFTDDLSGVLDDATWDGDVTADAGAASYAEPELSWSGPLAVGATATVTYSVTVNDPVSGDGTLDNAVVGPPESSCDEGTEPGCTADVPVRALEVTKTADPTQETFAGDVVTYTVTVRNAGGADYPAGAPASVTDDLSGVLDDATWNDDAAADVGTPSYAEPTLSWSGPLAVGEAATITYSVTVHDPVTGDGVLENAVVGPEESNCDDGDEDGCHVPLPVRDLTITKTAAPSGAVDAGSTLAYTVTVTNTGGVAYPAGDPASFTDDLSGVLDDATYADDAAADVGEVSYGEPVLSWSGALAPGETATVTYSVTVNNPPTGDGALTNAVVGPEGSSCPEGAENPGCTTDVPVRALHLAKSSDGARGAGPGDTVTYEVAVTNVGQVAYTEDDPATFDDDLSEVLDDAAYDGDATADVGTTSYAEPVLSWSGALAPGETATITYSVTIHDPTTGDGELVNVVLGPEESNCTDPASVDPETGDPDCVEPDPLRELRIDKTADPDGPVTGGDTVTYTVAVTNVGTADYPADDPASFTDVLAGVLDDATYDDDVTADVGEASFDDGELTWSGPLAAGETATVTYSVTVDDPPAGDATLANAVLGPQESNCPVVMPDGGGMAVGVSTAFPQMPEGCQVVTPVRAFELSKTADVAEAAPGDVVTYTVTVTSTGTAPFTEEDPAGFSDDLTDVLDDASPEGLPTASAGELGYTEPVLQWRGPLDVDGTVTVTYALRVDDPVGGDGTLTNVVTPDGSGGHCTSDADCTTTTDVTPPAPPAPGPGPDDGGFLPQTGAGLVGLWAGLAVVLILGGALLYGLRVRPRES